MKNNLINIIFVIFFVSCSDKKEAKMLKNFLNKFNKKSMIFFKNFRTNCNANNVKSNYIDVLDEYGLRTGEVLSRKEIHSLGKIHRAVHLYLFNQNNDLLMQRRSKFVDHFPNKFSISVTGHIDSGEISQDTVLRELQEELGLNITNINTKFLFSYRKDAVLNSSYIDKQFNDVYVCWTEFELGDIKIDSKEVSEVKLIPFSRFVEMVKKEDEDIAPVYKNELKDVIFFLTNNEK